jgi:hypothetical protein
VLSRGARRTACVIEARAISDGCVAGVAGGVLAPAAKWRSAIVPPAPPAEDGAEPAALKGAEAQRYVAPDLLRAAVEAGAKPARAIVEWALRNDVREWVEAWTLFIDGLVTRAPDAGATLSAFFRSLVLPFA